MESRPIPIEDLQSGEFYDIQISDQSPIVFGALLLERLPNNQAKLMLLSSSDFDRSIRREDSQVVSGRSGLQVTIMRLYTVYPYQSFMGLSNKILRWPEDYEGEELIGQIKKEMLKAVSEGCWVFNLPHFCGGYLPIYLSYLRCVNCPDRRELFDLLFEFMDSFFSVLRAHILQVKLLPEEQIRELLKAVKDIDQIPKMVFEISNEIANPHYLKQSLEIAWTKNRYFDSYRPIGLTSERFDRLWELIVQEYHQDLIAWQLKEPLSLRNLLLHSNKLIGILSCYPEYARDLMDLSFLGLQSEEMLKVKSTIEATAKSFRLVEDLVEHLGVATEELSRIILENELVRPILISRSEKLKDFVMSRAELSSSVLDYLNNTSLVNIQLNKLLKCVTAHIELEDWQFITFFIDHRTVNSVALQSQMKTEEMKMENKEMIRQSLGDNMRPTTRDVYPKDYDIYSQIKELIEASLKHQMRAELLRDLLPCEDYGELVFPALVEMFSHPKCREVMIAYLRYEKLNTSTWVPDIITKLLKLLTARIVLEDWEFVTLIITKHILRMTESSSLRISQEMCENVKELVNVALEHNMSAELLRDLLPCENYGEFVFPALVEMFSHPKCREVMIAYFRPDTWHTDANNPRVKQRILIFLESLAARIALEDHEFITFVIQNETLRPAIGDSLLNNKKLYENVKNIVNAYLEHNMSSELLQHLLPCVSYGDLVFPALIEMFSHPNCRDVMIAYLGDKQLNTFTSTPSLIIKILKLLIDRTALEDWEFVKFTIQNQILRPTAWNCFVESSEVHENVRELVLVALEHNMSSELLRSLLPCVDYGELVFPALVEMSSHPKCRDMMIEYFRNELCYYKIYPQYQGILIRLFKLLTTRIALEDWEFVNFTIQNQILSPSKPHYFQASPEVHENVKELVTVALEHNMSSELLRNLLPCMDYGELVFPALVEMFSHPKCREVMIYYFKPVVWHTDVNNPRVKERLLNFLGSLAARIALEDWEFITFVVQNDNLRPAMTHSLLSNKELYENVKNIVNAVLEHNMSSELLRKLLPYVSYGNLVFTALIEMSSHPKCSNVMVAYFRHEKLNKFTWTPYLVMTLFKMLLARIALEDWEFVNFIAQNQNLRPITQNCFLKRPEVHENVKELVTAALEHKMSAELLRDLLPCEEYGQLVFPTLLEMFLYPKCREVMVAYFRPDAWHTDVNNPRVTERLLKFLGILATRIALEDWEFITFVIQNETLRPAMGHSLLDNKDLYENVKNIVNAYLEHNLSSVLLRNLLPCIDYGHFVFPALVEMFSHPKCRDVMIAYFRHEKLNTVECTPDMIIKLLKLLTTRIALQDWEFVNFIAQNQLLRLNQWHNFPEGQEVYANVKVLVTVVLEHKMSSELLQNLLLCEDYGYSVFATFAKGFLRSRCYQMMISYFGSEQRCIDTAREIVEICFRSESELSSIAGQKSLRFRNTEISQYLQGEKLNLWYVFGGSVQIQFIWVKQFSQSFIKRLSPGLTREVCSYLA